MYVRKRSVGCVHLVDVNEHIWLAGDGVERVVMRDVDVVVVVIVVDGISRLLGASSALRNKIVATGVGAVR